MTQIITEKHDIICYSTRYLGSKVKLLEWIWENTKDLEFESILDAFSGTGVVGYMYKQRGVEVHSNDFLRCNYFAAKGLIENNTTFITDKDIHDILKPNPNSKDFIQKNYTDVFFPIEDTTFLDYAHSNVIAMEDEYKKAIFQFILNQSILKRTSFGRFTTTKMSSLGKKTIKEYFIESAYDLNKYIINNNKSNHAYCQDILTVLPQLNVQAAYFDPPYGGKSFTKYEHYYNFSEVYANYWTDKELKGKLKQVKEKESPFSYGKNHKQLFIELLEKANHIPIWIFSYNNNGGMEIEVLIDMVSQFKSDIKVIEKEYSYAGKKQYFKEYLIICK